MTMTVSAVMIINATATTPAMIPAVLSHSAHVEAALSRQHPLPRKHQMLQLEKIETIIELAGI